MPAPASSFSVATDSPLRAARALAQALARVPRPAGGVVFVAGRLAADFANVARELAAASKGTPIAIAGSAGVLSEDSELEAQSAAAGIVWAGGRVESLAADGGTPDEVGISLAQLLGDRLGRSEAPALVFMSSQGFSPHVLEPLQQTRGLSNVFGAGTVGDPGSAIVAADGSLTTAPACALIVRGLSGPVLTASPACRLLTRLMPVSEASGSLVLRIGDEPALDVLGQLGEEFSSDALVFAALAEQDTLDDELAPLLIRGVHGVDPVRRGLLLGEDVREGMRLAFAVRDASAARTDLQRQLRAMNRDLAGSVPRFGIYLNCAGRGAALYGAPDVDVHSIRARFPGLPIGGMFSSFEIAPHRGRPTLQLYTGVLALFTAPS